jgi:ammonium transporter, Amt family
VRSLFASPLLVLSFLLLAGTGSSIRAQDEKREEMPKPLPVQLEELKKEVEDLKKVTSADKGFAGSRGDTAWMLTASALVMLMVPGLALFYGGMVRRKNVLATMMQSMAALSIVGVYWIAFGYGLAFGPSVFQVDMLGVEGGGVIGWDWKLFFLQGIAVGDMLPAYNIPVYLHVIFQGMFAIITPALISGAVAERIRFWPFCIFMVLWITVVYCPLAHMVWNFDWFYDKPLDEVLGKGGSAVGLLGKLGALDFAGGTVVHIAAGFAGLAGTIVLRKRAGYPASPMHPNSMVLTLVGAGLLWFGWFGFNGGSSLMANDLGVSAFAATQAAAAAAGLSWIFVEWLVKGKPTALGLASGIVAGLVAVTPAAGFVYIWGGLVIGLIAGVFCYFSVYFKSILGYDDSLDAFGVHGVGGFLGAVLTGLFCYAGVQSLSVDGYLARTSGEVSIELKKKADELTPKVEALKKANPKEGSDEAKELADLDKQLGKATAGPMDQLIIQIKASIFSAVFAFVISFVLFILVQLMTLGNFSTSEKDEQIGLDLTEHGEVGFDFGTAYESAASSEVSPRASKVPPGTKRFEVIVDGVENGGLIKAWSELCQPTEGPIDPDFKAVYPFVTTVSGNKFRFRGGDAQRLSFHILKLFSKKLGRTDLKVRVEE